MSGNNHAMDEDEVDDFLYGSDASENNFGTTSKAATKKNIEEDEEIYEQYNEDMANRASTQPESAIVQASDATEKEDAMDEDHQDGEDDSDDDLDIILEADDDDHSADGQQPSSQKSLDVSNESTKAADALVNIKLGQHGKDTSQNNDTTTKSRAAATGKKLSSGGSGVDLDNVGEYNGQAITDVDLDIFEDKPWRKPGADITDYFNFGFNELSWKAYCAKQKNMRDKKATGKDDMAMPDFMAGMADMPDFMKMGMMMPMMDGDMPMGMVENGMPMGMMNPMMNQMMGMPPPPPPHRHQQMNGGGSGPMMNGPPMVGGGGGPNRGGAPMGGPSMGGPSMGGPSMGGPSMGGPSMGGSASGRPNGNNGGDRGGQGNQNYGGASGHGHSYTRGQRR